MMTELDKYTLEDAVSMLRQTQAQLQRLRLKKNKSDKDYARMDGLFDTEQELYETIESIDPEFLYRRNN